jgi:hypothetical protein
MPVHAPNPGKLAHRELSFFIQPDSAGEIRARVDGATEIRPHLKTVPAFLTHRDVGNAGVAGAFTC